MNDLFGNTYTVHHQKPTLETAALVFTASGGSVVAR